MNYIKMSLIISNHQSFAVTKRNVDSISNSCNGYWIWCSYMKCTSIWLEMIDAIGCDYYPWGIHEFGEICVRRTFVTTRRVGKDTVTTRRVGKDYCALRSSYRSGPSANARQWFDREISWSIVMYTAGDHESMSFNRCRKRPYLNLGQ
jgi:hypothetical protein